MKRIGYTVASTFLGRMCFSGDVTELSAEQWKAIEDGMAFYKRQHQLSVTAIAILKVIREAVIVI